MSSAPFAFASNQPGYPIVGWSGIAIVDVVPRVEFIGGGPVLFGEPIERIEPGEVGRARVEGKVEAERGGKGPFYRLSIAQGFWG